MFAWFKDIGCGFKIGAPILLLWSGVEIWLEFPKDAMFFTGKAFLTSLANPPTPRVALKFKLASLVNSFSYVKLSPPNCSLRYELIASEYFFFSKLSGLFSSSDEIESPNPTSSASKGWLGSVYWYNFPILVDDENSIASSRVNESSSLLPRRFLFAVNTTRCFGKTLLSRRWIIKEFLSKLCYPEGVTIFPFFYFSPVNHY